jgi:CDP-diacylglycerol--glycerol-3-phosphate 3-phosphatidyltransferase/cardiolipin synthase
MRLNIPNTLTMLRIALIPVFVVFFYLPGHWTNVATAAIFGFAAVTDWLDGYLARRLEATSAFGAFLDPVADKLMVSTALVMLAEANPTDYPGIWLAIPAAVIVGREITISALREWMAEVGARAKVAVSMVGKVKTTAQMLALLLLLYRDPFFGIPVADMGLALLYLAAILTLWSMVLYLTAAWPALNSDAGKREKTVSKSSPEY